MTLEVSEFELPADDSWPVLLNGLMRLTKDFTPLLWQRNSHGRPCCKNKIEKTMEVPRMSLVPCYHDTHDASFPYAMVSDKVQAMKQHGNFESVKKVVLSVAACRKSSFSYMHCMKVTLEKAETQMYSGYPFWLLLFLPLQSYKAMFPFSLLIGKRWP